MQRVVSIHLNGSTYQLEEAGYNNLFAYLDARETQLNDDPERGSKMADLEREVEQKIQLCLTATKTIVTSPEIDRILLELGPIPSADTTQSASSSSGSSQQRSTSSASSTSSAAGTSGTSGSTGAGYTHRRLYQVREGAMISGVCVGFAEYLHIDVTLLRILFVIFALVSSGWGVLAYGLLMFILPHVATRAEAVAGTSTGAHHWPWDNGWPWDRYGWPWDRPVPPPAPPPPPTPPGQQAAGATPADAGQPPPTAPAPDWNASRQQWRDQREAWREERRAWRAQRRAARMAYNPWGTFGTIIGLMFAFFWLSFWTRGNFFFGWPFFWGFPHWIGIVFFFLLLRLIFMPFRAARWYGYGYGPYGGYPPPPHHAWISMWNGLAWFLVIMFAVWFAYHYIPEVHDMIREFQTSWTGGSFHV